MIRKIVISDYKVLNQLNSQDLGYSIAIELTKQQLEKVLNNSNHLCLGYVDENNNLLGYIHVEIYDVLYAPTLFNVMALAVFSEHRRKGIGAALMNEMEKLGRENNVKGVRLNSGEVRKEAHLFYEKQGYEGVKWQKRFIKYFE